MLQDNTHFVTLLNLRHDWDTKWKGGKPSKKEIEKRSILESSIHREGDRLLAEQEKQEKLANKK